MLIALLAISINYENVKENVLGTWKTKASLFSIMVKKLLQLFAYSDQSCYSYLRFNSNHWPRSQGSCGAWRQGLIRHLNKILPLLEYWPLSSSLIGKPISFFENPKIKYEDDPTSLGSTQHGMPLLLPSNVVTALGMEWSGRVHGGFRSSKIWLLSTMAVLWMYICYLSCPWNQIHDLREESFVWAHGLRLQPSCEGRHNGRSSWWLWEQEGEAACSHLGWSRNTDRTGKGPRYELQGLSLKTPTSSSWTQFPKQCHTLMFQHMYL